MQGRAVGASSKRRGLLGGGGLATGRALSAVAVLSLACAGARADAPRPAAALTEPSAAATYGPAVVARAVASGAPAGPSDGCRQELRDAPVRASSMVLALTRDSTPTVAAVAQALGALADAIDAFRAPRDALGSAVTRMRQDALLLEDCDELDPKAPRWARDGLLAAVDAIGSLASSVHVASMDACVRDARAAALAIDGGSMLSFQRVVMQEAFRSSADALLFFGEGASRCGVAGKPPSVQGPPAAGRGGEAWSRASLHGHLE